VAWYPGGPGLLNDPYPGRAVAFRSPDDRAYGKLARALPVLTRVEGTGLFWRLAMFPAAPAPTDAGGCADAERGVGDAEAEPDSHGHCFWTSDTAR
jgi:hypothetical protein